MSKVTILGDNSGKIELVAPDTISPNISFVLPSADGSAGQVLATNGSGTLSFVSNDGSQSFAKANAAYDLAQDAYDAANSAASSSVDSTARAVANSLFDGTAVVSVDNLTAAGPITAQYITLENNGYYGDIGFSGGGVAITANTNFAVQTNLAVDGESGPLFEFGSDGTLSVPSDINTEGYVNFRSGAFVGDETDGNIMRVRAPLGYGVVIESDADESGNNWSWTFNTDGSLDTPGSVTVDGVLTSDEVITTNISADNIVVTNASIVQDLTVGNTFTVANVSVQWHPAPLTSKGHAGDREGYVAIDNDKLYRCVADYTDGTADIWVFINFNTSSWG